MKQRVTVEKYWPGPLTWDEIAAAVRALPERIEREDVGTVATIAGLLGVFGFPEGSEFREKDAPEPLERVSPLVNPGTRYRKPRRDTRKRDEE